MLDTNVISELRKGTRCDPQVSAWQRGIGDRERFISVLTLMELRHGILAADKKDPSFASALRDWYEKQVKPTFSDRTLPVDLQVAERCSELLATRTRPVADALIAATALVHELVLVTRNTDDFADTGVELTNPWEA